MNNDEVVVCSCRKDGDLFVVFLEGPLSKLTPYFIVTATERVRTINPRAIVIANTGVGGRGVAISTN